MTANMRLPNSVQEIADVIGRERALYLVGRLPRCYMKDGRGGANTRLIMYVPKRLTFEHELVRILGWIDAEKLCDAFGGEILHPAPCAEVYRRFRDEAIRRMGGEGMKTSQLAEWFAMSPRQITNVLAGVVAVEIPQEDRKAANDDICTQHQRGAL